MPALYGVGLTYLWEQAIRGPQSVDMFKSTFFFAYTKRIQVNDCTIDSKLWEQFKNLF